MAAAAVPAAALSPRTAEQLRAGLDELAQAVLARLNAYGDEPELALGRANLTDALGLIEEIRAACEAPTPTMIELAVLLGLLVGRSETWSYFWHERQAEPDTKVGRVVRTARKGKTKAPPALVVARVRELRPQCLKNTVLYDQVGDEFGISGKTVRRYIEEGRR